MALKYFLEFTDIKEILHRCEIYNDDFTGDAVRVYGNCSMNKSTTDDTLEAIRGGGLTINLEASSSVTFEDLYSEDERVYSVKYIRDGVDMFLGWLSPEGIVQEYIADRWELSVDCTDGLGFLKNLSYVENDTGFPFTGKQSALDIIVNCLKRTGLQQNIKTRVRLSYADLSSSFLDIFDNFYLNSNRYIKDDDSTYMDCDEVLRSVLEILGCCITQKNGTWYIYKPNELFDTSNTAFFHYDYNGVSLFEDGQTIQDQALREELAVSIGSQIDDFYPHHVNANQQITTEKGIGAYQINYKYGLTKSFFENIYLESINGVIDEWTINDPSYVTIPSDNLGARIDQGALSSVITSDSFTFTEGNRISVNLDFSLGHSISGSGSIAVSAIFRVVLHKTNGNKTYLRVNGDWSSSTVFITKTLSVFTGQNVSTSMSVISDETPIDGDIYIEVYSPSPIEDFLESTYMVLKSAFYSPLSELGNEKGEIYSFQRIENPSNNIEPTKEVFNGDEPTDLYIGTMYENDETTPTDLWYRTGQIINRFIPLLQITGEDRMKMYGKPLRVFSGDVFGYVDYLSVITINGIDNIKFMPIEHDYDAYTNITTLKLKQILNDNLGNSNNSDILFNLYTDNGNTQEPTIIG